MSGLEASTSAPDVGLPRVPGAEEKGSRMRMASKSQLVPGAEEKGSRMRMASKSQLFDGTLANFKTQGFRALKRISAGPAQSFNNKSFNKSFSKSPKSPTAGRNPFASNTRADIGDPFLAGVPQSSGDDSPLKKSNLMEKAVFMYTDPAGEEQGPFAMLKLKAWMDKGHLPKDLKVWRQDAHVRKELPLQEAYLEVLRLKAALYSSVSVPMPVDVDIPRGLAPPILTGFADLTGVELSKDAAAKALELSKAKKAPDRDPGMASALAVLGLPVHDGPKEDKYAAAAGVALPKKRWGRASIEVSRAGQARASLAIDGTKGLAGVMAAAAAINERKKLLAAAGMNPALADQDNGKGGVLDNIALSDLEHKDPHTAVKFENLPRVTEDEAQLKRQMYYDTRVKHVKSQRLVGRLVEEEIRNAGVTSGATTGGLSSPTKVLSGKGGKGGSPSPTKAGKDDGVVAIVGADEGDSREVDPRSRPLKMKTGKELPKGVCCHLPSICPIEDVWTCVTCGMQVEEGTGGVVLVSVPVPGGWEEVEVYQTEPCCGATSVVPVHAPWGWECRYCRVEFEGVEERGWLPRLAEAEMEERMKAASAREKKLLPHTGAYLEMICPDRTLGFHRLDDKNLREGKSIPVMMVPYVVPKVMLLPQNAVVKQVAGGDDHTLVLLDNLDEGRAGRGVPDWRGRVMAVGANGSGQLGLGDQLLRTSPELLQNLLPYKAEYLAGGGAHSAFATDDGELLCCGAGEEGQIGDGKNILQKKPVVCHWVSLDSTQVLQVACGAKHTLVLNTAQMVYSLGSGDFGQLGHGVARSCNKPKMVDGLRGLKVVAMAAGGRHSLVCTGSGLVYAWGDGRDGQLGLGHSVSEALVPKRVHHANWRGGVVIHDPPDNVQERIKQIEIRLEEAEVKTAAARVVRDKHMLEEATIAEVRLRQQLAALRREASWGPQGLLRKGELHYHENAFGEPTHQQLAARGVLDPAWEQHMVALKQNAIMGSCISHVAAGCAHSVALTDVGTVFAWGRNDRGQLGQGKGAPEHLWRPTQVKKGGLSNRKVESMAAAGDHCAVITTMGQGFSWGAGTLGQHGDGRCEDRDAPEQMQPEINKPGPVGSLSEVNRKAAGVAKVFDDSATIVNGETIAHPLKGVKLSRVYAGAGHIMVVDVKSTQVWTMGTGAYGRPEIRNPTRASTMLQRKLNDKETKKVMVIRGTFRLMMPQEQRFRDLTNQLLLYGTYNEVCCYHLMHMILSEVVANPDFCVLYAQTTNTVSKHTLGIPQATFRKVIVDAFEDLGVRFIRATEERSHRMAITDPSASFFAGVTDKKSLEEFAQFRRECRALGLYIKEIYHTHQILELHDIEDMLAGCPGSDHSINIADSKEAERKLQQFRAILAFAVPARVAELRGQRKPDSRVKTLERALLQRGDLPPPIYFRGSEEAAWDQAETPGYELYKGGLRGAGGARGGGSTLAGHLEASREAKKQHEEALEANLKEGAEERNSRLPPGRRRVESSLAASTHQDNIQRTYARIELEQELRRVGLGADGDAAAEAEIQEELERNAAAEMARTGSTSNPEHREAQERHLARMRLERAARGVPVRELDVLDKKARLDPANGLLTMEEEVHAHHHNEYQKLDDELRKIAEERQHEEFLRGTRRQDG